MFDFDPQEVSGLVDTYVIPWSINIVMALIIYVIGRIIVKILVNFFGKVMARSKYDDMLVDFVIRS